MAEVQHDDVTRMLANQIEEGIAKINEANSVLLAEVDGQTGVREIDKALKDFVASETNDVSDKDQDIVKAVAGLEKARESFKKAQEKARNLYRTNILGEDEVSEAENDVDVDTIKQTRKAVMAAVTLLVDYAEMNKNSSLAEWAKGIEVPQVGRQGSSAVGQKKPRAYVTVGDTTHDSFGEAAKALSVLLSTDDKKVSVTSPDLVSAWVAAGEPETFTFEGQTVKVTEKSKKAA